MPKSPTVVFVNAQVNWGVKRVSSGTWLAVCDPLKLTVQSSTYGELMEDIHNTLDVLMRDLLQSNELDRFLSDQGWTLASPMPRRQQARDVRFDVPFIPAFMTNGQSRELHQ